MPESHALLLTDVVDSTRWNETLGDAAMAAHWVVHDRAARDLLPRWGGREIDRADGMLLLFDRVMDAVGYALDYHAALAELPFKARAGIHVGTVTLRANAPEDVARGAKAWQIDGLALSVTARVMSIAQGGQTLLSQEARQALGIATQRIQSQGAWRLHGVAEPVELFEARGPDGTFTTPPDHAKAYRVVRQGDLWQPVREVKHNIPAERDSFVGRLDTLQTLAQKFAAGARLISVLGMGGTGKTRLVTRYAWQELGDHAGGVWFCDLSQARSLEGIHFGVAQGLDVPLGKTDPVVQIAHAIAGRGACLVILDNFEQVARHAEETLGYWLEQAPMARFLVTTREVLGIVGEETLALAPLPYAEASVLFHRRAEAAHQSFHPHPDDIKAIDQLVRVLDGLPLAIELAAARVRVMQPRALLARMNERFDVLRSRAGRGDRQATLRATFDWSWELLSDAERAALAQLSVFEGGFDIDSADAVLEVTALPGWTITADLLQWLIEKSFVRERDDARFDLLESVREYAAEHLRTEGRFPGSGPATAGAARLRHWVHFARRSQRAREADLVVDANNLVAACRNATANHQTEHAVDSLLGAWQALKLCGPFQVALQLARSIVSLGELNSAQHTIVAWVSGSAHLMSGHAQLAVGDFERALLLCRLSRQRPHEAEILCALGEQSQGNLERQFSLLNEALSVAKAVGSAILRCRALNGLGTVCGDLGRVDEARRYYEAALEEARAADDDRWQGGVLGNLGTLLHGEGKYAEAESKYGQSLAFAIQTGDRRWEGNARCNLGLLLHEKNRSDEALSQFDRALEIARTLGHVRLEVLVLCNLALAEEKRGDTALARRHHEAAIRQASDSGDAHAEGQILGHLGLLLARCGDSAGAMLSFDRGELLMEQAADRLGLATLICQRGQAESLLDNPSGAQLLLGRAEEISRALACPADSEIGRALDALREKMRAGAI